MKVVRILFSDEYGQCTFAPVRSIGLPPLLSSLVVKHWTNPARCVSSLHKGLLNCRISMEGKED